MYAADCVPSPWPESVINLEGVGRGTGEEAYVARHVVDLECAELI